MHLKQQPLHRHISCCRNRRSFDGQKLNVFPPIKWKAHSVQIWWTGTATHTCFTNKRHVHAYFVGYNRLEYIFKDSRNGPTAMQKRAHTKHYLSVGVLQTSSAASSRHRYLCHWKIVVKAVHTCTETSQGQERGFASVPCLTEFCLRCLAENTLCHSLLASLQHTEKDIQ